MAKLVAEYNMYVYDNGEVVVKPKQNQSAQNLLSNCSSSISQIVLVLDYVILHKNENSISRCISMGITKVASDLNLTQSTIHTKFTRKLGLDMSDFKHYTTSYFDKSSTKLEDILRNACVARTKQADQVAVEALICRMKDSMS